MRKINDKPRYKQHYNYGKPLHGLVRYRHTGNNMIKLQLFHVPRKGERQKVGYLEDQPHAI